MLRWLTSLAVVVAWLLCPASSRAAEVVDLYTVGAGNHLYSAHGHSVLCVRGAGEAPDPPSGRCYDFGIADREGPLNVLFASLRGRAIFVATRYDAATMLRMFGGRGRGIERQTLPLSEAEAAALSDRLESEIEARWTYAYHPYVSNCATQLRDRIDDASGRLRPGLASPGRESFRERAEVGLSGRAGILSLLALVLGVPAERAPDGYEALFLPLALRDGVAERFGVAPVTVEPRYETGLSTSGAAGRVTVFAMAIALAFACSALQRRSLVGALALGGIVLGGAALLVYVTAVVSTWRELSWNASLGLLLPTDLAIPWLRGRRLSRYLSVRIAMAAGFGLLAIAGVLAQPLLPVAALVLLTCLSLRRAAERTTTTTSRGPLAKRAPGVLGALLVLLAVATGRPARASDAPAGATSAPRVDAREPAAPRLKEWHGPFDPEAFRFGSSLSAGLIATRRADESASESGFELAAGTRSETQVGPFTLVGGPQLVLRSVDLKDFFLTFPRNVILGGVRLGPVGLDGGFGLSLLTLDFSRSKLGIGVLSPVASAGVTVTVGGVRLRAGLNVEYLWRLNTENVTIRGLTLTLYP